jgi:hypothetical protein
MVRDLMPGPLHRTLKSIKMADLEFDMGRIKIPILLRLIIDVNSLMQAGLRALKSSKNGPLLTCPDLSYFEIVSD